MQLRNLLYVAILLMVISGALSPYVVVIVIVGGGVWLYKKAMAWGEGIGSDDGYFDADDPL